MTAEDKDKATAVRVLNAPMGDNDAEASTVRDYLVKLLALVWQDGEGFDGKRPFGNSSWEFEVFDALANAGLVDVPADEYGGRDWWADDQAALDKADALVRLAIHGLGEVTGVE